MIMARAWMALLQNNISQAEPYLQRLAAMTDANRFDDILQAEWLALQAKAALMQSRPAESRDLGEQTLRMLTPANAHLRSLALLNLASAHALMFDYDQAAEIFETIAHNERFANDFVSETLGISAQAQMMLLQGRLRRTREIVQDGITRLEAAGGMTPFAATLYGEMGQVHFFQGRFDEARRWLHASNDISGRSGYSDPEIFLHIAQSRIHQMQGDWTAAEAEIENAVEQARRFPPALIRENVIDQQVRVHLAFGRLNAARELLAGEGFVFTPGTVMPGAGSESGDEAFAATHATGSLANSFVRVLLRQLGSPPDRSALDQAIRYAGQALDDELRSRSLPAALETLLLRSRLLAAGGDKPASLQDLEHALALAEPEGFISVFLEEGPDVSSELEKLLRRGLPENVSAEYVQAVLAAFPQLPPAAEERSMHPGASSGEEASAGEDFTPLEQLSGRELEVLRLIAAGNSNRDIAAKLVITVSAVKKHSARIYSKLGVNSRTQAAARARRLGLLSQDG